MQTMETNCTPKEVVGSILGRIPASPSEKIRAMLLLFQGGKSLSDLARDLKKHRPHMMRVIAGQRQSHSLQAQIADYLGVSVDAIWQSGKAPRPRRKAHTAER